MEDRGTSFLSTVVFNRVQSRNPRAGVDVSPTAAAPCPPGNISSRTFGVPRCFPGWDNAGGKLQSCSVLVSPHRIPIPAFHRACQGSAKGTTAQLSLHLTTVRCSLSRIWIFLLRTEHFVVISPHPLQCFDCFCQCCPQARSVSICVQPGRCLEHGEVKMGAVTRGFVKIRFWKWEITLCQPLKCFPSHQSHTVVLQY